LISGGVCSIVAAIFSEAAISSFLFKLAFFSYLWGFINLNPLLELDGYFILMDWLEIPLLRRKSLEFVKKNLWPKVLGREEFSRDEKIFSVFGVLAGAWSVCAIGIALYLWEQRVFGALVGVFEKSLLYKLYLGLIVLIFGVPLLVVLVMKLCSLIHTAFRWLIGNRYLKVSRNLIALLVGLSVGLTILSFFTPQAALETHRMVLMFIVLLCALLFAIRDISHYREGYLERTFRHLTVFILLLFAADLIEIIGLEVYTSANLPIASSAGVLVSVLRIGGYGLLLLSTLAFAGKNFRLCQKGEQAITLTFLAMAASLAAIVIRGALQGDVPGPNLSPTLNFLIPMALASVAVVLLLPGYFVHQKTEFRTAWLALAVAIAGMSTANILRFYERSSMNPITNMRATSFYILGYSLLASAMFGHYIIYTRVRSSHASVTGKPALRYDDRLRLRIAFADMCGAIFSQFISIYGERVTIYVQDKLNTRAKESGWELKAAHDKIEDNVSNELNIISLGEVYRGFLSEMLDFISVMAGKAFVEKAVQRGWDRLYWEEREVAAEYLFSLLKHSKKVTEELQIAERSLLRMLQEMAIFSGLSQGEIFLISSRLQIKRFGKGMTVVKQGDVGDELYIIKSGKVEVSVRSDADDTERIVAYLGEGEYFGEVALVGDVLRTATCRATTPLEVWALSKRDFNQLARSNLDLPERLDRAVVTMTMLKRMPLFREFRYKQLNMISSMLKSEVVPPKTVIIRESEPGDAFYIIRSGEVVVTAKSESGEETLARLGEAEYFGEIALVSNQPRTATVTSISRTELLVLEKRDFDTVVELISSELEQSGSRRLLDTRLKLRGASVAVEPEDSSQ
jgi:putative peptide zinc metalloprotease protein